ncbi:MAG: gamma-glutamyltransferase family protein [Thermoleophilia bacterium]|nr:gamma-glutamyltransferase family protein [Thermoleophilia bacterium]MDH4340515.1 gamma-glutamyltransferase family protein [Thermoleophilia bacterium]
MVASTHWLASQTGMAVLERGGNAFDAAVATGFVLQVVEPHLNGPGGEVPAVFWSHERGEPLALCGQGVAPAAATIDRFHELGHDLIPGTGLLAACVPGAFGGWLLLLREFGTWRLAEVLELAIGYAEHGYPLHERIRATIELNADLLREWAESRELYLPAPVPGELFRNPALAATYRRIVDESRGGSREDEIERARLVFYKGFVAEEIDRFSAAEGGLLTGADLAVWEATLESVVTLDYGGLTVCKTRPWAAGMAGLQQLALLRGFDLAELSHAEFVHVVTECAKLAFADRDALYGDADVPVETLLSAAYNDERRALVGEDASAEYRPGLGRLPRVRDALSTPGSGEPGRGTVHLDIADRFGNLFSATPSGGWLQSSPVIPSLGWPLGTRAQMFWLEEGLPSSLRPGARPRTTLSPGLALREGEPYLAWGTPGGDQQEQWALHAFLRHVDLSMNLQEAIDAPEFHTDHLISSFFPRGFVAKSLALESRFGARTVAELQRRGHEVKLWPAWSAGRVTAVAREPGGLLKAGANPRGMQGYAVGR